MIILNRKPVNRYIDYKVQEQLGDMYKIIVTYFIDKGNPISNVDIKHTKEFMCTRSALPDKIKAIEKNIQKTTNRLISALSHMGANEINILHIIEQKLR